MPVRDFNREVRQARADVERHGPALERAYAGAIRELGRLARRNLLTRAPVTVIADGFSGWNDPDLDELFTTDEGAELLELRTRAARAGMTQAATGIWTEDLDPTVRNRITGEVERLLGSRITGVADSVRDEAGVVIREAHDAGWSIDRTARELSSRFAAFAGTRATLIARTEMIGAANAGSLGVARATEAATHKRWLATMDERTRPTHADANDQVQALDDPFDVGGADLMYPGDENAPADEVCNCRCTITYEEEQVDDLTAAGTASADAVRELPTQVSVLGTMRFVTTPADAGVDAPTRFSSILAPIGHPTSDGRILDPAEAGAIGWRDLPLSMMWQSTLDDGHGGAVIAGRIDSIGVERVTVGDWTGDAFVGTGSFDDGLDGSAAGREAARLTRERTLRGVSIDLAIEEVEFRTKDNEPIADDDEEGWLAAMFGDGLMAVTRGKIMGATIVAHPAFEEASVMVAASLEQAAILAAAAAPAPAAAPTPERVWSTTEQALAASVVPSVTLAQAQGYVVLTAGGIVSPNEVRAWLGLPRVVGGNAIRVPSEPTVTVEEEPVDDTPSIAASLAVVAAAVAKPAPEPAPVPAPRRKKLRVVRNADGQAESYEEVDADA